MWLRLPRRYVPATASPQVNRQRRWLIVVTALIVAMPAADRPPPRADRASVAARASQDPPRAHPVAHGLSRDPVELAVEAPSASPEPTPDPTPPPTPQHTPAPTPPPTPALTPPPTMRAPAPQVTMSANAAELRMLALINGSRSAAGLVTVALDAQVSATARAHSTFEAQLGYVYHDGPDGTSTARDSAACGSGWYGENTGKVWNGDVDALHMEFMSEPWVPIDHRTITMDPTFRRIGIGAVQGRDALYMTMVFCR